MLPYLAWNIVRVLFGDETGIWTNMARLYGWAPSKDLAEIRVPLGHWNTQTAISFMGLHGIVATKVITGSMNAKKFYDFLKHKLLPLIPPDSILVLDNLPSHKTQDVLRLHAHHGIEVVFLPG